MATRADSLFVFGAMDLTILIVNIAGAFLLGVFLSGSARFRFKNAGLNLGIAVGFFGSFTTFSTLSMEAAGLLQTGNPIGFFLYVVVSCIAGLGVAEMGFRISGGSDLLQPGGTRGQYRVSLRQNRLMPAPIRDSEEDAPWTGF